MYKKLIKLENVFFYSFKNYETKSFNFILILKQSIVKYAGK